MALGGPRDASTIWITNDWRAGMSKALMMPCASASATMCQTRITPASVKRGESQRLQHGEDLRDDEGSLPVPAVNPHARDRGQEEHRDLRAETGRRPAARPTR